MKKEKLLIIGGTGSLGQALIRRLIDHNLISIMSRDEAKAWTIRNEYTPHLNANNLTSYIGDVRDLNRVKDVIRQARPTHIIIASALKQVDTCELSPSESVLTNVLGTQNVITAVNDLNHSDLDSVLLVSTDKACAPVNVYGMCKSLSERLVTSQARSGLKHIRYLAVRYGNVLESRGSIIPLFKYQSEHSNELTVTDPEMTRFVMTLDDSVTLITTAITNGASGTTWIPKLPAMKIGDLAELFSERTGKPIKYIGLRPGEKMHEDLINASESVRAVAVGHHYYSLLPAFNQPQCSPFTYASNDAVMTKQQLCDHLTSLKILDRPLEQFRGLAIEEIITNRND